MNTDTFNFRFELASSLNGSTLLTILGTLNLMVAIVGGIGVHNENAPIGEHFNYMGLLKTAAFQQKSENLHLQPHSHLHSRMQMFMCVVGRRAG